MEETEVKTALAIYQKDTHGELQPYLKKCTAEGLIVKSITITEWMTITIPGGKDFHQRTIPFEAVIIVEYVPRLTHPSNN